MSVQISIVIPVYNTEKFLKRCLDSAIQQSYKNIEIIIVNDASPDNSEAIILEYQQKDPRIKYIKHEVNKGLFTARETGVRAANGAYILHLDSDDWLELKACESISAEFHCNPDIIMHSSFMVSDNFTKKNSSFIPKTEDFFEYFSQKDNSHYFLWQFTFKKEIALKVYDDLQIQERLILSEDLLMFLCFLYYTKTWAQTREFCYNYNEMNLDSATRKKVHTGSVLRDLEFTRIVIVGLEKFRQMKNLDKNFFDKINQKQEMDRIYEIRNDYKNLDWELILPKFIQIFGTNMIVNNIFDIRYIVSMKHIHRKIITVIIKIQEKIFPDDSFIFCALKNLWYKIRTKLRKY